MLYKTVAVFSVSINVLCVAISSPPTWTTPYGTNLVLDPSVSTACDKVTEINADSGDGSTVSYSLFTQTPNGGFAVGFDSNDGNSILTCDLSTITASMTATYNVVVRAENSGVSADKSITITVTGKTSGPSNPNAPVFSGTPYQLTVNHDDIDTSQFNVGSKVITVSVMDSDAGQSVSVSISGSIFTMDDLDVKIADKTTFTSLECGSYEYVLTATDNGSPAKSSSATLTVTFKDCAEQGSDHGEGCALVYSLTLLTAGIALCYIF